MIATFKETWASIRNPEYGQEIVKKTVGQAFWYWLKYVLFITLILVGLAVAVITYFTPQMPKLIEKYIPDISVTIKDGQLSTTAPQPLKYADTNLTFILDTQGKPEEADQFTSGVLVLKDRIIIKDATQTRSINLADIGQEVQLDKKMAVDWLQSHKLTLLSTGLGLASIAGLVMLGIYLGWKGIIFIIGGLLLLVVARVLQRRVALADTLKLIIYAAVPSLWISLLFIFSPHQLGSVLSLGVWILFACIWLIKLPQSK